VRSVFSLKTGTGRPEDRPVWKWNTGRGSPARQPDDQLGPLDLPDKLGPVAMLIFSLGLLRLKEVVDRCPRRLSKISFKFNQDYDIVRRIRLRDLILGEDPEGNLLHNIN